MNLTHTVNANPRGAWRAMAWKEWRENARWAVLTLVLLSAAMAYGVRQASLSAGFSPFVRESLTSSSFVPATFFGCAAAALLLGIMQTLPERRPDSWALLVHRPVSRSWLFAMKAMSGLALYFAAALLPMLGAALWASRPGHIPAPFDWRLTLPALADILTGISYYFTGMLIGLRPARWYGSRLLVLATAVITSFAVIAVAHELWQALVCIAIGSAITATAARASFVTGASTQRQPRVARFALGFSIFCGLLLVGTAGVSVVASLFEPRGSGFRYAAYYVLPDATVILATTENQRVVSITDTAGKPLEKYKDTSYLQLIHLSGDVPNVSLNFDPTRVPWRKTESYRSSGRYFTSLQDGGSTSSNEAWYYVYGERELIGYDSKSAVRVGAVGPGGFVAGEADVADRFDARTALSSGHWYGNRRGLLFSPSTVYDPLVQQRGVDVLFQAPVGDTLQDAVSSQGATDAGPRQREFLAAATAKTIYIVPLAAAKEPGIATAAVAIPLSHDPKQYGQVSVGAIAEGGYAVRYYPSWKPADGPQLPGYVEWISAAGKPAGEAALPPIEYAPQGGGMPDLLAGAVSPPAGVLVVAMVEGVVEQKIDLRGVASDPLFQPFVALCLIDAVLCAAVAFVLTRRYAFTRAGRIGWTIAVLLLGPAALLTLLAMHAWPALERCPSCGRKRVVTHEACDYCTAGFPPPPADGTEILVA